MTNAILPSIASVAVPASQAPAAAPAALPTTTAATPAATTPATGSAAHATPLPLNPHLHVDPTSGVLVTEILDSQGHIQTQWPSNKVLAYLHLGLSANGTPSTASTKPGA